MTTEKNLILFIDYPVEQVVQYKLDKEQGESFGFRKFQRKIHAFLTQNFGVSIPNLEEMRFTTTDYVSITKVSEIVDGQTLICMFTDEVQRSLELKGVGQNLPKSIDATKMSQYESIIGQVINKIVV
ncbi:hypothetical protein OXYTRIMIC_397 [Oxytricha trifallax]|uniref:Uncharacterized protein n=1 Tax=Oxytricha trifallax TaxID=1172189 RepID=A0A073HZQ5_9SPIT|nr:hypothetical protein OXYTRIMIC_397 [Oxytricha trifallax]